MIAAAMLGKRPTRGHTKEVKGRRGREEEGEEIVMLMMVTVTLG